MILISRCSEWRSLRWGHHHRKSAESLILEHDFSLIGEAICAPCDPHEIWCIQIQCFGQHVTSGCYQLEGYTWVVLGDPPCDSYDANSQVLGESCVESVSAQNQSLRENKIRTSVNSIPNLADTNACTWLSLEACGWRAMFPSWEFICIRKNWCYRGENADVANAMSRCQRGWPDDQFRMVLEGGWKCMLG
jgi:hypothetical protein